MSEGQTHSLVSTHLDCLISKLLSRIPCDVGEYFYGPPPIVLRDLSFRPRWTSKKLTNLIDHVIVIRNNIDGGFDMQTVTVSPKYQVVIPKAVRQALHLRPGQKMQVVEYDGRIELIPERDIKELRGFLKGINTEFEREEDRV
jgi:AbrB family looped-hinge helix DNA binding protein